MTVQLTPFITWKWTCPDCGEKNEFRGRNPNDVEMQNMNAELELVGEECDSENWVFRPDFVFCRKCETKHDVEQLDEED